MTVSRLLARGDTWTYRGDTTRSTVELSDDHHVQTVLHERTDDGTTYGPSMKVTLTRSTDEGRGNARSAHGRRSSRRPRSFVVVVQLRIVICWYSGVPTMRDIRL